MACSCSFFGENPRNSRWTGGRSRVRNQSLHVHLLRDEVYGRVSLAMPARLHWLYIEQAGERTWGEGVDLRRCECWRRGAVKTD